MVTKRFDNKLFAENDVRAREAVMRVLNHDGIYAQPNDDKYGPDLVVYVGYSHKYYVECEIKLVWKPSKAGLLDGVFPWPTVQIPERKLKFTAGRKDCEFWVLRADLKYALIIPDKVLRDAPLVEVPNKLIASGERFAQVPVEQCIMRELV